MRGKKGLSFAIDQVVITILLLGSLVIGVAAIFLLNDKGGRVLSFFKNFFTFG